MALRDIALIWLRPPAKPPASTQEGRVPYPTLRAAIIASRTPPADGLKPWLRVGTGFGSTVLDEQGIAVLVAAFEAGHQGGPV
ncbi:hypothetical protein [Methylobacterium radiodurans]|uniref:Uncharacterized protein n=1 Tax=Methylobacterium radiodurans TaxID=2202828 RepID=A0A2U8VT41_9HYPH|nr:hypothetical protein [Methylobacterium radiodurans]AWN36540.1 hypothetical protein DK427_13035 [Methylobacterium radiodurans]